jgi:hypothetical protein
MPTKRHRHPTHHPSPLVIRSRGRHHPGHGTPLHRTRTGRAAGRPTRGRPRGRPHPGDLLVCPAAPARRAARSPRRAGSVGRLAHPAGPLRAARPHRTRARQAPLQPGRRPGSGAKHGESRTPPPRRAGPHLPPRLRGAALARQDPAALCPYGPGLQRLAPAARRTTQSCRTGDARVVGRGQGGARAAAQAALSGFHAATRAGHSPDATTRPASPPSVGRRRLVRGGRRPGSLRRLRRRRSPRAPA